MFRKHQKSSKRIKIFEYVKNNLDCNGFLVLQEIHSSLADEKKWVIQLEGPIFFSHAKTLAKQQFVIYEIIKLTS